MKFKLLMSAAATAAALSISNVYAEEADSAALLKAFPAATVSLQQGLEAATAQGKPISGKFEMDNGKLQLSVYTIKGGKFAEVIVDYGSGKVLKVEPITQGDDLVQAKAQASALAKAKTALKAIADKVEHDTPGSRVVSVTPAKKDNKTVAAVAVAQGNEIKTIEAPL
jgi:hypothetical protein